MRTVEEWKIMARIYLEASAGRQIPGMTHNANNFCHVLEMQQELFLSRIKRNPELKAGELAPKFTRFTQAIDKLAVMLRDNEQHAFYTEKTVNMIDIKQFVAWLNRFWDNNLFFKHKLIKNTVCHDKLQILRLPPYLLTLSLNEALKNAIEACMAKNAHKEHEISLQAAPHVRGAVFLLTSPTTIPANLDPWAEGTTSKSNHLGLGLPMVKVLAEDAGWSVDLVTDGENTTFRLEIPEQKTE